MGTIQASWEDTETNRRVDMAVAYEVKQGQVVLRYVTPQRVHFGTRSIGVWTNAGQQKIASQADRAGWTHTMREQLAAMELHELPHHADAVDAADLTPATSA